METKNIKKNIYSNGNNDNNNNKCVKNHCPYFNHDFFMYLLFFLYIQNSIYTLV